VTKLLELRIRSGAESEARYFTTSPVTLGRDGSNRCVLDDPRVSRHHARWEFDDSNVYVVDIGSRNGTFSDLASPRIPPQVSHDLAHHGMEFVIGRTQFSVRLIEGMNEVDGPGGGFGRIDATVPLPPGRL
jgi:pSer/pThr/pTyr-binding forkhead associated (FHA) protein